jgi:tRNA pseudouridine38-40 synthase
LSASATLQRYAIGIEYDGSASNGWQIQPHAPSVQESLHKALSLVADTPTECVGAGRTDTGVHATGQVAHFESMARRSARSWLMGLNTNLPPDIAVVWLASVQQDFHARFSALSRSYRYVILNRRVRAPLERGNTWWVYQPLNHEAMHSAAAHLLGTHDFSAFRASSCQAHSAVRNMTELSVRREGDHLYICCRANAFLHHMVRNIVGSLVKVGKGEADAGWMKDVLEARDRRLSGITAPATGLSLTNVEYPVASFANGKYVGDEAGAT